MTDLTRPWTNAASQMPTSEPAPAVRAAVGLPAVPGGAGWLVGGALALAIGRLLTTAGGSPAQRLDQMSGRGVLVTGSVLLTVVGFTALVPGFWAVAARVRAGAGRGMRLSALGAGLVLVAAVCFGILASVDLVTLAATRVADRAAMQDYLHQLDVSPGILALTVPAMVGYLGGPFLVVFAARRARLVAGWLPWATLASLVLQPVGAGLGGPWVAHVLDAVLQLALVGVTVVLARTVLRGSGTSVVGQ